MHFFLPGASGSLCASPGVLPVSPLHAHACTFLCCNLPHGVYEGFLVFWLPVNDEFQGGVTARWGNVEGLSGSQGCLGCDIEAPLVKKQQSAVCQRFPNIAPLVSQ